MPPSRRLPIRISLRRAIACALVATSAVVGCTQLDAWQREAIFSPANGDQRWFSEPPEGTQVFDLAVAPAQYVRAWYWKSPAPLAPTVLYLHGARWNLNGSAFRMASWTRMGYSVLAIDYRGFGDSTRLLPSEETAGQDAAAALQELARRQPDPARRFVYGHSLGGAIAIDLASRKDVPRFAGLIVESSFTSIAAMLGTLQWGWVPGASLLVTQPFDSIDKLADLTTPVLFLHGTNDRVVPHTMSDQLFAAAQRVAPNLKRLVKIDGASHSGAVRSGQVYAAAVESFVHDATAAYHGAPMPQRPPLDARTGAGPGTGPEPL
jgi:alpha-beta hydrolase superfamily lysophospholipase